jgi:hypothetical protein
MEIRVAIKVVALFIIGGYGAVEKVHIFPLSGLLVIQLFSVRSLFRN